MVNLAIGKRILNLELEQKRNQIQKYVIGYEENIEEEINIVLFSVKSDKQDKLRGNCPIETA